MKLTVRRAAAADLPTLLQIFDNARAFMRTHGNPHQWPDSYPGAARLTAEIERGVEQVRVELSELRHHRQNDIRQIERDVCDEKRRKAENVVELHHLPGKREEQRERDARDDLRVRERDIRHGHRDAAHPAGHGADADGGHGAEHRRHERGVHKRAHVFHANVTHTTTIPANQARRSQTRQPPPKRHTFKAPTAPHRHNVQPGTTAAYRHKSITFPPATVKHSKKSPRGVQRGRGFAAPLRFSSFIKKTKV